MRVCIFAAFSLLTTNFMKATARGAFFDFELIRNMSGAPTRVFVSPFAPEAAGSLKKSQPSLVSCVLSSSPNSTHSRYIMADLPAANPTWASVWSTPFEELPAAEHWSRICLNSASDFA